MIVAHVEYLAKYTAPSVTWDVQLRRADVHYCDDARCFCCCFFIVATDTGDVRVIADMEELGSRSKCPSV